MEIVDNNMDYPGDAQDMVDKLLAERQEMLVMFCTVAGLQPFGSDQKQDITGTLQRFCEVLVDYSAFGHFEVYGRVMGGEEGYQGIVDVVREAYPCIAEASEVAVAFNDRYDSSDHTLDINNLDADLSKLGEELAMRIEMEDRIIAALLD